MDNGAIRVGVTTVSGWAYREIVYQLANFPIVFGNELSVLFVQTKNCDTSSPEAETETSEVGFTAVDRCVLRMLASIALIRI